MATTPTLAMIPSAYKSTKVYSVIPNTSTGDFTFARSGTAYKVNKDGLLELCSANIPRISYDLSSGIPSQCPHLLLEQAATNICLWSESIANWNKSSATVVANDATSPDGKVDADIITITANGGSAYSTTITVTASTEYTFSFYVKLGTISSSETKLALYDLSNTAFISSDVSYTASTDYWTRVEQKFTTPSGCTQLRVYPQRYSSGGIGTLWVWGCQVETGNYATSYIPNNAMSGSTTRSTETCNSAGDASTFNSEGVFYAEVATKNDGNNKFISISSGSSSYRVTIYFYTSSNTDIRIQVYNSSEQYYQGASDLDISEFNKIAVFFKENLFKTFVNGSQIGSTDTSGSVPTGLNQMNFDNGSGGSDFYGNVKDIRYYDTKGLSNTEITNLLTEITS